MNKKLLFAIAFWVMSMAAYAQTITVRYESNVPDCGVQLYFGVQTEIDGQLFYRLTVYKTALPGGIVTFDLSTEMSETLIPAADFTDPTRPQFGGAIGSSGVSIIYNTAMPEGSLNIIDRGLCAGSSKTYFTRNGEFHFTVQSIVDDLNGLIR
jgi:hypothetical protein